MLWLISPQKWTLSYRGKNYKEKYLKGSKKLLQVIRVSSNWGYNYSNYMRQIQGKSVLLQDSGVRIIGV